MYFDRGRAQNRFQQPGPPAHIGLLDVDARYGCAANIGDRVRADGCGRCIVAVSANKSFYLVSTQEKTEALN